MDIFENKTIHELFEIDNLNFSSWKNDSNNETDLHSSPQDIMYYTSTKIIFYCLYITIFLLGIFGNCLVCYVVFRSNHMRTVTNYFIASLAMADILLCLFAVPLTAIYFFMQRWVFGHVLCQLLPMAQGASIYISSLTLTSIAFDRYIVILYPFRPRLSLKVCYLIIMSIWVISILATSPYGIYMAIFDDETGQVSYCIEQWPSEDFKTIFSIVTPILQFLIPFIIISLCYVRISIKLNERGKPGQKSSKREEADRERKRRTNRMLISMVSIFGISWFPVNIINFTSDFYPEAEEWIYFNLCFFASHVLAMSSTCYNPFLYAWLNENFRREFQQVLPCFRETVNTFRSNTRVQKSCNGREMRSEAFDLRNTPAALAKETAKTSTVVSTITTQLPSAGKITCKEPQVYTTSTDNNLVNSKTDEQKISTPNSSTNSTSKQNVKTSENMPILNSLNSENIQQINQPLNESFSEKPQHNSTVTDFTSAVKTDIFEEEEIPDRLYSKQISISISSLNENVNLNKQSSSDLIGFDHSETVVGSDSSQKNTINENSLTLCSDYPNGAVNSEN